jgi:two-component system, response regulator
VNSQTVEILLVEDNPNDLELALRAFAKHNLANSIEVARDGQEALDYLLGGNGREPGRMPRVILLDLKLPKVDGLQVLRTIRDTDTLKHLPVVILTSSREERDIIESYNLGVNSYIVKPVDFDSFSAAVAEFGCYWLLLNKIPPGPARAPSPAL